MVEAGGIECQSDKKRYVFYTQPSILQPVICSDSFMNLVSFLSLDRFGNVKRSGHTTNPTVGRHTLKCKPNEGHIWAQEGVIVNPRKRGGTYLVPGIQVRQA